MLDGYPLGGALSSVLPDDNKVAPPNDRGVPSHSTNGILVTLCGSWGWGGGVALTEVARLFITL